MATRSTLRKPRSRYAAEYLLAPLLGSLLAVLTLEGWGGRTPFSLVAPWETMPLWALAANVVVLWGITVFVAAITCRPRLALLATVDAYGLLFLLNFWKLTYVKSPLMLTDVFGWKNAVIAAMRYLSWGDAGVLAVLVVVPFLTLAFPVIFPPFPGTKAFHIGLSFVTTVGLATFFVPEQTWEPWLAKMGRVPSVNFPAKEIREQGLLLTQVLDWPLLRVGKPAPYGTTPVRNVIHPFRDVAQTPAAEEPVDVVLFAMDGFADPMRWRNPPAEDPIAAFRAAAAEQASGVLSVPVHGVDTGGLEFELLTGFSTALLPVPSVPFERYVHRNLDALPRIFARYGYRTVALRPESAWLLGRSQAYLQLGFSELKPAISGGDGAIVDEVIEELDPVAAHFIAAFTATPPAAASIPAAQARDAWLLRLRTADESLGRLIESLRTRTRRTMLVAFGANVPVLPGLESELADAEDRYRTPLLVWTNYPRPREALDENVLFLGSRILEWTAVPSTPVFRFGRNASEKIAALRPDGLRDRSGNVFPPDGARWQHGTQEVFPWVRSLWLLEYDQLFGAQYASPAYDAFATKLPPVPTRSGVRVIEADPPPPTVTPDPPTEPAPL